jgi:hypothetical protein
LLVNSIIFSAAMLEATMSILASLDLGSTDAGSTMKMKKGSGILVVVLDENDEVISSIGEMVASEGVESGIILSFVGALKSCHLILRKGVERSIETHLEAVGNGNISLYQGRPFVHLHISAGNDQGAWVGHLTEGIVDVFCEVAVLPLGLNMVRSYSQSLADSGVTVPYRLDFG